MDPVLLVAIISAAAAIVASVGAQVVGATLSRRTERDRTLREDDRYESERQERRAERFNENKRTAFVRYLQIRNEYRRICQRLYLEEPSAERRRRLEERARICGSDIEALEEEIGLLDPSVHTEVLRFKQVDGSIRQIDAKESKKLEEWILKDFLTMGHIRVLMRQSLAITPAPPTV